MREDKGSSRGREGDPRVPRSALVRTLPAVLGACAIVLAACAACSSSGGGSITIGYENNGADPSLISVNQGYFQKELGAEVRLQRFISGPDALSDILSGSLQFMCGLGLPPSLSAIDRELPGALAQAPVGARGTPVVVVWNQERYTTNAGIVVKKGSGITSLAGLKGRTIGITIGSQASFDLPELLQVTHSGISVFDVHQLNLSPPQMLSAWAGGKIQAAIVWAPTFDYLAADGGRILATDASLPVNASSYNVCVSNRDYVSSHHTVVTKFVRAMADGVDYMKSNPAQALAIMSSEAGITTVMAEKELAGYHIYTLADQVTEAVLGHGAGVATAATTQSMTNNWNVLHAAAFLSVPPPADMAQYVDPVFAQAALGKS